MQYSPPPLINTREKTTRGNTNFEIMEANEKIGELLIKKHNELNLNAAIEYGKYFLSVTGLAVGDIVDCRFTVHTGNAKQSYMSGATKKGLIKVKENGVICVESIDRLPTSRSVNNGRTGRARRDWWEYENKIITTEIDRIDPASYRLTGSELEVKEPGK